MPKQKTNRKEIIKIAWRLFHANGYSDTSLQQIATATGLGKAGILHYFGSKRGLMDAVLEYSNDWYARNVLSIAQEEDGIEERLRKFLKRHIELAQINQSGCFFANTVLETGREGQFAHHLRDFHKDWIAAVTAMFSERFNEEDAEERAYRCFTDYEGSVMLYKLYHDPTHLYRFVERSVRQLETPLL